MKSAIFIPARLTSQRLRKKLLSPIGNQPLIAHVIDRAKESEISDIILATDSQEIIDAVKNKGVRCVMTSNKHLSGTDRIYEALSKIDPKGNKFNHIINLQGDLPLINPEFINYLHNKSKSSKADIVTLAAPLTDLMKISSPNVIKPVISFIDPLRTFGKALYFSRQPIPYKATMYYEHIGMYAYKRYALETFVKTPPSVIEKQERLEQLRIYETNMEIEVHLIDTPPISVDTKKELAAARLEYQERICKCTPNKAKEATTLPI